MIKKSIISFICLLLFSSLSFNTYAINTLLADEEIGPGAGGVGVSLEDLGREPDSVGTGAGGVGVRGTPVESTDPEENSDKKEAEEVFDEEENTIQPQDQGEEVSQNNITEDSQGFGTGVLIAFLIVIGLGLFVFIFIRLIKSF